LHKKARHSAGGQSTILLVDQSRHRAASAIARHQRRAFAAEAAAFGLCIAL
jgi:hypothetical protein